MSEPNRSNLQSHHFQVAAKMREQGMKNLSRSELDRVFGGCASPIACERALLQLHEDGYAFDQILNLRYAA